MSTNRYEALLILDIKGGDTAVKDTLDRIEAEIVREGGKVEGVQKMERRQFSYVAGKLASGYYVNFIFEAAPEAIDKLKAKFRLDNEVYRQTYTRVKATAAVAAAA